MKGMRSFVPEQIFARSWTLVSSTDGFEIAFFFLDSWDYDRSMLQVIMKFQWKLIQKSTCRFRDTGMSRCGEKYRLVFTQMGYCGTRSLQSSLSRLTRIDSFVT